MSFENENGEDSKPPLEKTPAPRKMQERLLQKLLSCLNHTSPENWASQSLIYALERIHHGFYPCFINLGEE